MDKSKGAYTRYEVEYLISFYLYTNKGSDYKPNPLNSKLHPLRVSVVYLQQLLSIFF